MSQLVSRNTIKLPTGASASNDYYVGYTIVLTRTNNISGKESVQRKQIAAYNGATRIATIHGIWDADFIPTNGDKIEIIPTYPDSRVTINPAMQTMDYITSDRYGRGLHPMRDLRLTTWLESARICDKQSDVTLGITGSNGSIVVGSIWKYPASGNIVWQGTVQDTSLTGHVRFTDIIGKIAHQWNSWKSFELNQLVYNDNRLYRVTVAGPKTTKPIHASGTTDGLEYVSTPLTLTKVSGGGTATTISIVVDGNPARSLRNGVRISGYSLYDSDGVNYWRYQGWESHDQRWVTQHQTNLTIDTAQPLFENTNNLLAHFGGIMRYHNGKYDLEVESAEGPIPNTDDEVRNIEDKDIIGKIRLSDDGIRSSYNSLTVAFADPANKFEAKNISFFNSDFLKADRSVPKKGNLTIPGVTNYYNARLLADKYLTKSRYGLTVSFNMAPRGALLLAGRVIQMQQPRYGWTNKKFRITDITHNTDCTVDIVAEEYDDSFYAIRNVSKPPAVGLASESVIATLPRPTNLSATNVDSNNENMSGVELNWINGAGPDNPNVVTQIYASPNPDLYITVTEINGTNTFVTDSPHNLTVGDTLTATIGFYGLDDNRTYYVVETPTATSFRLGEIKGGAPLAIFENGTGLEFEFMTAIIVAEVPVPENSYIDIQAGIDAQRVERFYWIRHKARND